MEPLVFAAGSALLSRQIVEGMKEKNWIKSRTMFLVANFVVNFIAAIIWASSTGVALSGVFVWGVAQAVGSSIYHDFKTI
jgi:hypothetical protein